MSRFDSRLGIGEMIHSVDQHGHKTPYIIGQVLFSNSNVEYRTFTGTKICFERELDNVHNSKTFYFTSKIKRDNFIKSLNL